jgi:hypothetical protein
MIFRFCTTEISCSSEVSMVYRSMIANILNSSCPHQDAAIPERSRGPPQCPLYVAKISACMPRQFVNQRMFHSHPGLTFE